MINDPPRKEPLLGALSALGLTAGEIALYETSLDRGPQPLSRLAAILNISRPNIYKLVNGLADHGLAQPREKSSEKDFTVASPSRIAELLEAKRTRDLRLQNELLRNLPRLLGMYKAGGPQNGVQIFQGESQFMGLLYGMLDESKDSCDYCGSLDDSLKLITHTEQMRWINERTRRGIMMRTLTLDTETARRVAAEDKLYLRQTRFLPADAVPFQTSLHMYGNKILFWQPENMLVISIQDGLIVQMMRSFYELLWASARLPKD